MSRLPSRTTTLSEADEPSNTTLLERIHNFLADEDIHRNYDFHPHLLRIEEYLNDLFLTYIGPRATKAPDFAPALWDQARLMVQTHKQWIEKDRKVKPVDFHIVKLLLEERSQILAEIAPPSSGAATIIPRPVDPRGNPAIPKEVKLTLALSKSDAGRKKASQDPLEFTKKAAQHLRLKEYVAKHTEDTSITSHIPGASANFHGPYIHPVTPSQVEETTRARIARIDSLITALEERQKKAPRPLLAKLLTRISEGRQRDSNFDPELIAGDNVDNFTQWTTSTEAVTPLSKEDITILTIPTEPSWSSHPTLVRPDTHPESRFTPTPIPNLGLSDLTIPYNGLGAHGPPQTMDKWAVYQRLGYRLGVERTLLANHRYPLDEELCAKERSQEDFLEDLIENRFPDLSLDAIIHPLLPPNSTTTASNLSEAQKSAVLRSQIVGESVRAENSRVLDHSKLWAFAATTSTTTTSQPAKQYFSVSRWPTQILSAEMRKDVAAKAPVRDRKVEGLGLTRAEEERVRREEVRLFLAETPRERVLGGEAFFPFGETRGQEAVLSRGIMRDLMGVPGYDFSSQSGGITASILGKLNPLTWFGGGKKRKAGVNDDGNAAAGTRRKVEDEDEDDDDDDEDENEDDSDDDMVQ